MRDFKILLEVLHEDFKERWCGIGFCHQINKMLRRNLLTPKEHQELSRFLKQKTGTGFLFEGHYDSLSFQRNRAVRLDWLQKQINKIE